MVNRKIIHGEKLCVYCGEEKFIEWDGDERYFVCNCKDTLTKRDIEAKIDELYRSIPKPKYRLENRLVLVEIKHSGREYPTGCLKEEDYGRD